MKGHDLFMRICNIMDLDQHVRELYALVESGWKDLHGIDPWASQEGVIGSIKV